MRLTKSRRSIQFTIFLITAFLVIIFQKNVFNVDASANDSFQASKAAYIVAGSTIIFISISAIFYQPHFFKISKNQVIVSILSFYLFASVTSIASALPTLSAFHSISGLGLVLASAAYGKFIAIKTGNHFEAQIFSLTLFVGIAYLIGTTMFQVRILGVSAFPIRGGMSAAIFFTLAIWKWLDFRITGRVFDLSLSLGFAALGTMLYSASSVMAFIGACLLLLFMNKRYFLGFLFLGAILTATFLFYQYLLNNLDAVIFNKPARAFLIGTGRFPLYSYALNLYFEDFSFLQKLIGVGFLAEREYLIDSGLSWTTNIHNSLLSDLLGVGIIGFSLSLLFTIFPFVYLKLVRRRFGTLLANKWISFHLIFVFFGMTSIDYPCRPSWLLVLFIAFSASLFTVYQRNKFVPFR